MADEIEKLQAEIDRLTAEATKFRQETEESRWRMRPIWTYGKWLVGSIVAGITVVLAIFGFLKEYWAIQNETNKFQQEQATFELNQAKEREKQLAQAYDKSYARGQAQLKAQQADFAKREALLIKKISLLSANGGEGQVRSSATASKTAQVASKMIAALKQADSAPSDPAIVAKQLRSTPKTIRFDEILASIRRNQFSLIGEGIEGSFRHGYVLTGDGVIFDKATNLMWQSAGSDNAMTFGEAKDYVSALHSQKFGGYDGWRLPTIEELLSLLEPRQKNGALYIDAKFSDRQRWIISSDNDGEGRGWGLVFYEGKLYIPTRSFPYFVRAVRTQK
ncbi:MAG: DUF1566 domain-containing protein [Rhodospirillaceae bacterium]|nr:DUF1566 domain-containing protein [Rhodospirillaceae bacterium]